MNLLAYWNDAKSAFDVEADQVNVISGSSSADIKPQQAISVDSA